ncbi:MAG: alkaline phosphatase D family protein [Saprospiraceae bacterium]
MLFRLFLLLLLAGSLHAQSALLQSGPMVGYVDMKEARLWAQTNAPAAVDFDYWDIENPNQKFRTAAVQTQAADGFTAHCVADQVEPGRRYEYRLRINGQETPRPYPTTFKTQSLWQWRTDPPAFTLAIGSCMYVNEPAYDRPGKSYGSDYQILGSLAAQQPDVMLWLGDNTYLREPDWYTRRGMLHRYTHTRSLPELQPLLAASSNIAIWDDHDFGPNDSDGSWVHKEMAWDIFRAFWDNPIYGVNGQKGVTGFMQYADVDFFLLDDRYFRAPNDCKSCPRTLLGQSQLEWFKAALAGSRAPFKIVAIGGQFLSTAAEYETYINLFAAERDSILAFIERENIKGVVFVSGDRHFSELSALKNNAGNMVYDMTSSSLTAGVNTKGADSPNTLRVPGSAITQHNFTLLRFSGPRKERQLDISVHDTQGAVLWNYTIKG